MTALVVFAAADCHTPSGGYKSYDLGVADGPPPAARPRIVALHAGAGVSCVALSNGHGKCWGENRHGALATNLTTLAFGGEPGEQVAKLPPICLPSGERAVAFAAGVSTCVLSDAGRVRCFGDNYNGSRGSEDNEEGWCGRVEPVNLGAGRAVAISGMWHTCALLDDASVKCWGENNWGELGLGYLVRGIGFQRGSMGDHLPAVNLGTGRKVRAVAPGAYSTCAILDEGVVKCWGSYVPLGERIERGMRAGDMGDALPAVDLGTGRTAVAIAAGHSTCVILDNGDVKCWGSLGCHAPVGDRPGEMGDALRPVPLGAGRTARTISVGTGHACAVVDDGTLRCWGHNSSGELGLGYKDPDCIDPRLQEVPAVPLGPGRTVRLLSAGMASTCVVLDNDDLKCWGMHGSWLGLADGDERNRGDTPDTIPALLPAIDVGE